MRDISTLVGAVLLFALAMFGGAIIEWFDPGRIDRRIQHVEQEQQEKEAPLATSECTTDSECAATPECQADPDCDGGPAPALSSPGHWERNRQEHPSVYRVNLQVWKRICTEGFNWNPIKQECV